MKILIVAATELEIAPFINHMNEMGMKKTFFEYTMNGHAIFPLTTGIGSTKTAYALATYPSIRQVDLIINVGLAGAYNRSIALGTVVEVYKDKVADLGAEEQDGSLLTVYDLKLEDPNQFPFSDSWLANEKSKIDTGLIKVSSQSANTVSGSSNTISKRDGIADLETMEGYGFAYACKCLDAKYLQIRAISNYVEPRNRANWLIHESVDNLSNTLISLIQKL